MINLLISTSILMLLVIVLRFFCRNHISMRLQYGLWFLVAVKLLIFPVPWMESAVSVVPADRLETFDVKDEEPAADVKQEETGHLLTEPEAPSVDSAEQTPAVALKTMTTGFSRSNVERILLVLALLGSGVCTVIWGVYNLKLRRYFIRHRNRLSGELPFVKGLPVYTVEGIPSPCLYGKAIYVTEDCTASEERLRHVLAHEYSHYRQGDRLWSVVRGLCLICYWWHPLVWISLRLCKQDCELSCDEEAIRLLGDEERLEYGRTLLGLIQTKETPKEYLSIATTMTSGKKNLKQRIAWIAKKPRILLSVCAIAVFGVLLGTVSTCTVQKNRRADVGETVTEATESEVAGTEHFILTEENGTTPEQLQLPPEGMTLQETYEACLNHDVDGSGEIQMDKVEVYTGTVNGSDEGIVLVYSGYPANDPYSIEVSSPSAGENNIYLVPMEGKDYIMELHLEKSGPSGNCSYRVYEFGEQLGPTLATYIVDEAEFSFEDGTLDEDAFHLWVTKMESYLKDANLLLGTQDGMPRMGPANDYDRYREEQFRAYLLDQ